MKTRSIICIGSAITSIIFLVIFTQLWFVFLTAFCISVGLGFRYAYLDFKEENEVKPEMDIKQDGEDMDWQSKISTEKAYQYLTIVNYNLRVKGKNLSEEEVSQIEDLIDDLRNLLLIMEDSKAVLKWKVSQICVDFMPKLINRYIKATGTMRVEIMATTINDIKTKVAEIENVIETNNEEEFEFYANTLQKIMNVQNG
jgi:hypothetical protein